MEKRRRKAARRFGIRAKMLVAFGLVLPVVIFVLGLVIQWWMFDYTTTLVVDTRMKTDISVVGEIATLKNRDEGTSNQVLLSPVVIESLAAGREDTALERFFTYRENQAVLASMTSNNDVAGIYVCGGDGLYFRSDDNIANLAASAPEVYGTLAEKAALAVGRNVWSASIGSMFSIEPETSPRPYLYVVRQMRPLSRGHRPVGTSIIQVNAGRYIGALQRAVQLENEYACIVDGSGAILMHSSDDAAVNQPFPAELWQQVAPGENGHAVAEGKNAILVYLEINRSGWMLVHYIPIDDINASLAPIGWFVWAAMLFSLLVLAVILIGYSSTFVNPITRLAAAMKDFGRGDIRLRLPTTRQDEIGDLERQFNDMAEDIMQYMRQSEEQSRARTKLELKVLENQINPHFLYNTLDLINWRSRVTGQPEIAEMTSLLAQFFRIGLHEGREYITVEQEIEHAKIYLEICKLRYAGGFDFSFDIPQELLHCRIKKLVLQPVIENAIKHGVKGDADNAMIHVTLERDGGDLLFHVRDNGRGMSARRLAQVQSLLGTREIVSGDAFGMQNINRRIVLAYGEGYGLAVESRADEGTHIAIRLAAEPPEQAGSTS